MNLFSMRSIACFLMLPVLGTLASCATIKVNPIPVPPATAKLRVYVEAFTLGPVGRKWGTPHQAFSRNQIMRTGKFLEKTGIYEVVPDADVRASVGDQVLTYDSMRNYDWAQAREIGKALHADYVLAIARDKSNVGTGEWIFIFTTELVNVETGKVFKSRYTIDNIISSDHESQLKQVRETYRDMFSQAKHDMLAVAVRKGRANAVPALDRTQDPSAGAKTGPPSVVVKQEPPVAVSLSVSPAQVPVATVAKPAEKPAPKKEEPAVVAKAVTPSPDLPGKGLIEAPKKDSGAKKLVVYDLESTDQYRTMALILAEALREEVFKLKQYILVNREDLQKVLEEMALQQTGLIDEKEAVKTGKGLAASQVVTGRLGQLGKTFVMQAKRVDVETFATLGISSVKFTEGQEDEALNKLPDFAKSLVGLK